MYIFIPTCADTYTCTMQTRRVVRRIELYAKTDAYADKHTTTHKHTLTHTYTHSHTQRQRVGDGSDMRRSVTRGGRSKGKAAEDERLLGQCLGLPLDRALTALAAQEAKFVSTQVCLCVHVCVRACVCACMCVCAFCRCWCWCMYERVRLRTPEYFMR
jgi:hypothetical protein